jgi:hypothetical protein
MKGDDSGAWTAWWDACLACHHYSPVGCTRLGVVAYKSAPDKFYGFPLVVGGCTGWTPDAALERRA